MSRIYNFSAGPAMLPEAVMDKAREEFINWRGTGMSVMEISHRSSDFVNHVMKPAEKNLRELMQVPENYKILFVTGGASSQFAMVPLNLLGNKKSADYFNTGIWSQKAINEAKRFCVVNIAASSEINGYTMIPSPEQWQLNPDSAYVHYTPNETINGVEFPMIPEIDNVPLVADMSSSILSQPIDVSRFGIIYAGAQKNMGPPGLAIVIIREDLIGYALSHTPTLYNYNTYAAHDSLYNTPNTFAIYMANLVFTWVKEQGGLKKMGQINQRKAQKLYELIDASNGFYRNNIERIARSRMNIVFYLPNDELQQLFLQQSHEAGLAYLKGHKTVGGIRASIYNAMPEEGVDALVSFMKDFMQKRG